MKFSLMMELQICNSTRQKEIARILSVIKQAKLPDTLGFLTLWAVEHHGLLEYSHLLVPEVQLGHLSSCTKTSASDMGFA